MKILSILTVISAFLCCNAEVIDLTNDSVWQPLDNVLFHEKTITATGRAMLRSKQIFNVDPAKKYTIKLTAASKNVPAMVYVAFIPLGKYNEELATSTFYCHRNTLTQVAADAKKGDKKIMVRYGDHWKIRPASCVVKNAKADDSDIPNKKVVAGALASAVKKGNLWELTFKTPLRSDVKANDFIRQHQGGGYLYFGGSKKLEPNKVAVMQGTITGRAAPGLYNFKKWPHNVNKARLVLLLDWSNKNALIDIKNATLTIE